MSLIILLLLFIYKVYILVADIRIGIHKDPMLCGGIKFAVATRAEELKKISDVPCLDSKGGQVYSEALVPIYKRWLEPSQNTVCNLVRVRRLDCFRFDWVNIIVTARKFISKNHSNSTLFLKI